MTGVAHPADAKPDAVDDVSDEFVAADAQTTGPAGPSAPETQAAARERLALERAQEPSPDLSPSLSAPADAFHEIEARFARGEIGLADYEAALPNGAYQDPGRSCIPTERTTLAPAVPLAFTRSSNT